MDNITLARLNMLLGRNETQGSSQAQCTTQASLIEASKVEKIVDYSFERNEKSNVLAIHPTHPLIAYLINIQRPQMISKGWSSGNDSLKSPSSSSINGQNNVINQSHLDKNKTVSIRIIDYETRQRCLAKGIYHARPADCVFTINSLQCNQANVFKLAVVDRLSNIYLYNLSYFVDDLTATRIAVIRGPAQDVSPYESISLVWCPFVPCEDFEDGDGGLRLALATNSKIEIFAIDRLQGKTGELKRNELKGAYRCIPEAHKSNIVTLSISPDCSTISAAALDNRVTFFSSDIDDDGGKRCLHDWEANITDGSSISKLFFLDDYPKLLEDSSMMFWGAAFIGTRGGSMHLVDLRTWTVYQKMNIGTEVSGPKNFDYRIDLTSHNIVAMNGNQCFIVQIKHDYSNSFSTSKIVKINRLDLHHPIYSFVIKLKSPKELDLFTISAYSLERYTINLDSEPINVEAPLLAHISNSNIISNNNNISTVSNSSNIHNSSSINNNNSSNNKLVSKNDVLDATQMDRLVEVLFTKLNTAFSQGLDEFLSDVKGEVNTLCRDVRKLQQQLQEFRQK